MKKVSKGFLKQQEAQRYRRKKTQFKFVLGSIGDIAKFKSLLKFLGTLKIGNINRLRITNADRALIDSFTYNNILSRTELSLSLAGSTVTGSGAKLVLNQLNFLHVSIHFYKKKIIHVRIKGDNLVVPEDIELTETVLKDSARIINESATASQILPKLTYFSEGIVEQIIKNI